MKLSWIEAVLYLIPVERRGDRRAGFGPDHVRRRDGFAVAILHPIEVDTSLVPVGYGPGCRECFGMPMRQIAGDEFGKFSGVFEGVAGPQGELKLHGLPPGRFWVAGQANLIKQFSYLLRRVDDHLE